MSTSDDDVADIDREEELRAQQYAFLGALLQNPPDQKLLDLAGSLEGDDTDFGMAINALAHAARGATVSDVDDEFHDLFLGVGRGELVPHGSYYLTGFMNEKPLAQLRRDMAQLGIARADDNRTPEDNIASLCEMMAGLIRGQFGKISGEGGGALALGPQSAFFNAHLAPWAGQFFKDLEAANASVFFKPVGTLGRVFIEIEETAFQMAA